MMEKYSNSQNRGLSHEEAEHTGMIERYLKGQLAGHELERFEDHYFECRECLNQLEVAEVLEDGLRAAAAEDLLRARVAQEAGWRIWMARRGRGLLLALLAIAILLPVMSQWRTPALGPDGNTPVFFLGQERGASVGETLTEAPTVQIQPDEQTSAIVLALEFDSQDRGPFEARLRPLAADADPRTWSIDGLVIDHNATLTFSLPQGVLEPGDHLVTIHAAPDRGPLAQFLFRILPGEGG